MSHVIDDVSDTALWVATYRAIESERPDALFRDPLAGRLAGEKGRRIAAGMAGTRLTEWAVVIRTCIIDGYFARLASEVDVVLNLGAGLDTRPYRLDLPANLRWIEVDYPHVVQHKNETLRDEKPRCLLERVPLDLADREARKKFFAGLTGRVLVLTEGVLPYLSNDEVGTLADDLRASGMKLWIADYVSPRLMRMLTRGKRKEQMKNAPLRFFPDDWFEFFRAHGWKQREIHYYDDEARRVGRPVPRPWWAWVFLPLMVFARFREQSRKLSGYVLYEPVDQSRK
jgi:methyltransferase (TIGR00027 family)